MRLDPVNGELEHRRYLLSCFAAVLMASSVSNGLFAVYLVHTWRSGGVSPLDEWPGLLLVGLALGGWVGLVVIVARLAWQSLRWPTTALGGVSLLLGALMVREIVRVFRESPALPDAGDLGWWATLLFERATNPSSWLSPLVPIMLVTLPLYLWAMLNLDRLSRPRLAMPGAPSFRELLPFAGRERRQLGPCC